MAPLRGWLEADPERPKLRARTLHELERGEGRRAEAGRLVARRIVHRHLKTMARIGVGYDLPVIFAGNTDARDIVLDTLKEKADLSIVENIRPVLERENLQPARDKIHNLFMEHVMAQAPGYKKLMAWTPITIMPTPGAVGSIIHTIAKREDIQVIGVDIGGATTDVFSVFQEVFNRTVSANLGMSYSISNVLTEAGVDNAMRWVPFSMDEKDLRNRIRNKMIRPTTIPHSLEELMVEQAMAREVDKLRAQVKGRFQMIGESPQMQKLFGEILAQCEAETGLPAPVAQDPLPWAAMESPDEALRRVRELGDRQMTQTE